jgi:hypothetical protein
MAAEIHPSSPASSPSVASGTAFPPFESSTRPELINKFEGGADEVNAVVLIGADNESDGETGVITISNDR